MGIYKNKYPNYIAIAEKSLDFESGYENLAIFEWCMRLGNNTAEENYNLLLNLEEIINASNLSLEEKEREKYSYDFAKMVILEYAKVINCTYTDEKQKMIFVINDMMNDLKILIKDENGLIKSVNYVWNLIFMQYLAKYRTEKIVLQDLTVMSIENEISPIMFISFLNNTNMKRL